MKFKKYSYYHLWIIHVKWYSLPKYYILTYNKKMILYQLFSSYQRVKYYYTDENEASLHISITMGVKIKLE